MWNKIKSFFKRSYSSVEILTLEQLTAADLYVVMDAEKLVKAIELIYKHQAITVAELTRSPAYQKLKASIYARKIENGK